MCLEFFLGKEENVEFFDKVEFREIHEKKKKAQELFGLLGDASKTCQV